MRITSFTLDGFFSFFEEKKEGICQYHLKMKFLILFYQYVIVWVYVFKNTKNDSCLS